MAETPRTLFIWDELALASLTQLASNNLDTINWRSWGSENSRELIATASQIVLLVEIRWGSLPRAALEGIRILEYLRAEATVRCPIVVCSFICRRILLERCPLLRWAAHHPFVRLPASVYNISAAAAAGESVTPQRHMHMLQSLEPRAALARMLTHETAFMELNRVSSILAIEQDNWNLLLRRIDSLQLYADALHSEPIGIDVLKLSQEIISATRTCDLNAAKRVCGAFRKVLADIAGDCPTEETVESE